MIIVSVIATSVQPVQAPAPDIGKPNIPAPTQTPVMMHAPPKREGCFFTQSPKSLNHKNTSGRFCKKFAKNDRLKGQNQGYSTPISIVPHSFCNSTYYVACQYIGNARW